jgi:hypothetical protein
MRELANTAGQTGNQASELSYDTLPVTDAGAISFGQSSEGPQCLGASMGCDQQIFRLNCIVSPQTEIRVMEGSILLAEFGLQLWLPAPLIVGGIGRAEDFVDGGHQRSALV